MKFGFRVTDYLGDVHDLVRYAVLAEVAGFDMVWNSHDPFMRNTWVITSAIAVATNRIQIGSVGTTPYLTDPSEVAMYVATLDELSNGRAVVGYGLHTRDMVEWVGVDTADYLTRTREAIALVRAVLTGEVAYKQGEVYQWSDQCYMRHTPVRAEVPIYVCPHGPEFLRLSGEIGDGSLPMITPPESAPYMVNHIRAGAEAVGRDPNEVDIAGCAWLSLSEDARAAENTMRQMIAYFGPYLEDEALGAIGLSHADFLPIKERIDVADYAGAAEAVTQDMLKLAITGTPKDVIQRIEYLAEAGITQVNLGGPIGPDIEAAIDLMGKEVIPYFG